MQIRYHNIHETRSFVATVLGEQICLGRSTTCDVVLKSPFVCPEAAILKHESGSWTLQVLNQNGCILGGMAISSGKTVTLDANSTFRLFPYEFSLDPEDSIELTEDDIWNDLENRSLDIVRRIHVALLEQMNLAEVSSEQVNEEYLLRVERNLEVIAKDNGIIESENRDLVLHLAGHCVRGELIDGTLRHKVPGKTSAFSEDSSWSRLYSKNATLERELQRLQNNVAVTLNLVNEEQLTLRMKQIDTGFRSAWKQIASRVLDETLLSAHVRYYVQQLSEYHRRDCLRLLSERLKRSAEDPTCEPSETIDAFLNELESIRAGNVCQSELITASQALEALDSRNNDPAAVIPTGLSNLDRQLRGGLRSGQLIVIGGRPGLGKSALMDQIILSAAKSHRPGMIASLEMSSGEIAERALKTIGRQRFVELPVWFSEASDLAKLTGLIRLARRQHHIDVAAVDYLQLMESPREKHTLREQQVSAMSRALKRLAMELQIPILLGSQLNRESEKRVRPSLADLRESGAIEQDADIVILIAGDAESDERELIVAKHRGGPCDIVKATFDRPKFLFHTTAQSWTGHL